jgi:pimeloyl-ACP methyl ester carboxylesterase
MDDEEREEGGARADEKRDRSWLLPFLTGMAATGVGLALAQAWARGRRTFDPRLIRRAHGAGEIAPVVVVPGIMGSGLLRGDGTHVWLNLRNAVGSYNLGLPFTIPLHASRDDLIPGTLLGSDTRLPRLFGFTEYYDLLDVLEAAGFRPAAEANGGKLIHHLFTYDWRRDIVEAARRLDETLEAMADARGDRDARFNVVAHSMGGLVARYYLRYGSAEPAEDAPVTWAGARRIRNLLLVAVPNGGSIPSLEGLLFGSRVGLSYTTLAAPVIARMPSVYQLLPPAGMTALLDQKLEPLAVDLHDVATWERFGWGPFAPTAVRRLAGFTDAECEAYAPFLRAVLDRARAFHRALARCPSTPCPVRVMVVGGDCLPTLARGVVPQVAGPPRFEPRNRREADAMFEAGDGRVTRASLLASHQPGAEDDDAGCGIQEASRLFIGSADHHGIYREPSFQSVLLRTLLKPTTRKRT